MQRCPVSRTTSQRRLKQTLLGCFRVIFKLLAASAETGASQFDDEFPHQYSVRKQRAQQSETMKSVFTLTSDLSHTCEAFWVGGCVVLDDLWLLLRRQRQNNSNSTWNSLSKAWVRRLYDCKQRWPPCLHFLQLGHCIRHRSCRLVPMMSFWRCYKWVEQQHWISAHKPSVSKDSAVNHDAQPSFLNI